MSKNKALSLVEVGIEFFKEFERYTKMLPKPPKGCHYEPIFRYTKNDNKWDITMGITTKEDKI